MRRFLIKKEEEFYLGIGIREGEELAVPPAWRRKRRSSKLLGVLAVARLPGLYSLQCWPYKGQVPLKFLFNQLWRKTLIACQLHVLLEMFSFNLLDCHILIGLSFGRLKLTEENGSVSRVKAQGDAILSLQLPWDSKLAASGVKLESRSSIQRLCIIESTFKGKSSAILMSANYPFGLPEDELMTWQFVLPSSLRADINFINYTKPNCERKYERVEYSLPDYFPDTRVLRLDDVQPVNIPGSFNLSLYGCDQDDVKPGLLSLLFKVVVDYPKNEENVTYQIDLTHEKTNLTVYSKSSMNECLICVHSSRNCKPNVTLEYGRTYFVTFLCQNLENIRIIAEQSIVCWNARTYIEKIQIKDNVTITLKTYGKRWFNESNAQKGDLKLFFKPVLQEDCIFTLSPDPKTKVYIQTPNWLEGLLPLMSVYWNISVPPKQVAQLTFLKERMGVTCEKSRAFIYIKEQSPKAVETVFRDDNVLPKTLNMRQHFWINVSNCKPSAKQQLSLQFLVTFQKNSDVTVIIGVVAGGMAVLAIIGLLICCVKKKRKNKRKESQNPVVGVYNANVNTLLPGRQGIFKKERKKNDSHVYAVIEDVMVYGHLLDNSTRPEMAEGLQIFERLQAATQGLLIFPKAAGGLLMMLQHHKKSQV
ncbi:CUB domain-containing protein 1 [Crotalus adamanteus]|uniref:CUB domain-containing protein 1 n=1 Tax=Crotalus adamanteus TaxID=8729 RepID=A0AAW1B2R4_CROAD